MSYALSGEDIRNIILNAHLIKELHKCPKCEGHGWENWNGETGEDVKPGRLTEYDNVRTDGECEKCSGVGYVDWWIYSE